ncbi:hypothetical protein FKM82_002622 [Ascaphus truei]
MQRAPGCQRISSTSGTTYVSSSISGEVAVPNQEWSIIGTCSEPARIPVKAHSRWSTMDVTLQEGPVQCE